MESILLGLAALACPVSMGVMMWWMAKGMGKHNAGKADADRLDDLRAEHRRLAGEIERLERSPNERRQEAPAPRWTVQSRD
jgi:hypothetical protein